ncbi:MAG TPA: asparagine synthase (glutamine-hydrolyzing) [Actinophytocola sp.]|uniref:asparagine synthase (glutamine-hydrolyzing) n=1 Tax=Actinophytocola sp. TaxID=1872138 RepID=UPI002DDD46F6|nr:asparagine synthase (glutamine-hydrolyzing) [Actinophytocola sp.]HEV2778233.1 asparagine synthase (glutamine-hydrolyzing) [Actinophytocola sp.]
MAGFLTGERLEPGAGRLLDRMLSRQAHRGPDGRGQLVDPAAGVAMGQVRLAINDLSPTGAQPLSSADRRQVVTVVGEIYDFQRMRARLTAHGERFATKSDSELVLALYRRHGLGFVEHLRGEFAIALFDRTTNRLVLVRDRFGVRPLYYHATPRLVAWASEAKALLSHPGVPRRLCRRAAVNQLVQVMVPGTSAFETVNSVPAGHVVVVDRGRRGLVARGHRYWDMRFPPADGRGRSDPDECREAIRDVVVDALAVRTAADVPVGVYLSGGMDSGGLLGLAVSLRQDRPRVFTLGFADPAYDESGIAKRVAGDADVELTTRHITDDDLYGDNYVKGVWHSERTFYNTLGIAKMQLSAFARAQGTRAVISGEGADELFAGYPAFAIDQGSAAVRNAEADNLFAGAILPTRAYRHPAFERICGFTPGWVQPWVSTWERVRPLLAAGLSAELGDYDPLAAVAESLDRTMIEGRQRLDVAQYTWIKTMLDGQILSWGGDRVDMANAVESRPVFLDHRVAEVAARIPPELRIRNGREKWVLREALRFVLPDYLYRRRKFAFMAPPAHRTGDRSRELMRLARHYLTTRRIEEAGLVDPQRTHEFLDSATRPQDNASGNEIDKVCNHLLGLHILHDLFIR